MTKFLMYWYTKVLFKQGLLKTQAITIVASMSSELCVIGIYAVLNITLPQYYKPTAT